MSTRCTIKITDADGDTFFIYRHSDGYPYGKHGVPAQIPQALRFAWELPRFEAMDFTAALIHAWKRGPGNIYVTHGHERHADTVYQYNLTVRGRELWLSVDEVGWMDTDEASRPRLGLFAGPLTDAIRFFARED